MGLKIKLLALVMLLCPALSLAQTTTVTATITDSDAQTWNNGSVIITFVPTPGVSGQYYIDGVPMTDAQKGPFNVALNGGGTFTRALTDNNHISPAGTQWLFTICSNTSASCSPVTIPLSGTSVNLSTTLSSKVTAPRFPAKGTGYYGYSDVEVSQIPGPGGSYFNVSSGCMRVWNGSVFNCSTGGSPGGSNPQVQFNNAGNFGGDARFTFNPTTGVMTESGSIVAGNINNIVTVDGVKYTTLGGLTGALSDARCATGCTIDMRGNSSGAALNLGSFDPGSAPVTLLLGPYTYSVGSITVESNFHLIGSGMGQNSVINPTILQSNTNANVFVMPTSGSQPIQHLLLEGFRLYANPGNTSQIGMNFVGTAPQGGIWYSTFRNICVGICAGGVTGFKGGTIVFDATTLGSPASIHQFNDFHNVQGFRATTGNALKLIGTIGQFTFDQCQFDGTAQTDGGTDVLLSSSTGTSGPYSITFNALTAQEGNVGVSIAGAQDITFINSHHETVNGAYLLQVGTGPTNTTNITIQGSSCTNFCGNNSVSPGTGYFVNDANPSNVTVKMVGNSAPSPDNVLVGFPLGASPGNYMEIGTDFSGGGVGMRPGTYTQLWAAKRFGIIGATNLTTGAFAFGGSWGTSPAFTGTAGSDSAFWLTFTSGSGSPGANPTITLTFADGAWAFPPVCIPVRDDTAGGTQYWAQSLPGLMTTATFTFVGTPAASTTYGLAVQCFEKQN